MAPRPGCGAPVQACIRPNILILARLMKCVRASPVTCYALPWGLVRRGAQRLRLTLDYARLVVGELDDRLHDLTHRLTGPAVSAWKLTQRCCRTP